MAGDLVLCQIILATLDIHTVRHLDKYLVTHIVMPASSHISSHLSSQIFSQSSRFNPSKSSA